MLRLLRGFCFALFLLSPFSFAQVQQFASQLYQELHWRMIGPYRGGRTVAVAGVRGQPQLFYMAAVNGGVWKSTDFGDTWRPIFDGQPSGSVGALAVAPSNPDIIYAGSGEGLRRPDLAVGDGIYKSTDAGQTWQHLGLRDAQQINAIIVDPGDPNRVFVAAMGHPYGPNAERGVFRSLDGGQSWRKVLYRDEDTGAADLAFDPADPQTVYATLWAARRPPWTVGNPLESAGSGLYKSTDGGSTWREITQGLPTWAMLGRIGLGVAPSDPKIIYALVEAGHAAGGLFRSDDAGESWGKANNEERIWGRGSDFAGVRVDPRNPEIVYVANTTTYKSTDGGRDFSGWKGAPGGDDYHSIWINPDNPDIVLLGSDQGATITVNGGRSWSSWYNQPTAQFYHVITDNRFPYWVYGGQQESGSIGIASRSDDGEITFREWHPVGTEEYGYVAPDPLNPNIIYGGKATRFNWVTKQVQDVSPVIIRSVKYRFNRTAPLIFSPVDPHILYLGSNVLFETANGGQSWQVISPDLTRPAPGVPANLGAFAADDPDAAEHRGVIYTVAPSPRDGKLIWIGTDDGLIQLTRDGGKNWINVTPPALTPWSKTAMMDAGHFDSATAYAAVNRFRLDDLRPYIYRTHDFGKSWQLITAGLPENAPVNTVREDRERRGLLFCGTETSIYVSFDDGDHWQSLQLNLPATSMRDMVIHGDDAVVGTHGRSFWILDDITPLRQLSETAAAAHAFLFRPEQAWRIRRDENTDTPLPPEYPAGQNPPEGAPIDYLLGSAPTAPVTLEIFDSGGHLVRRFSSDDKPAPVDPKEINVPYYWVRPPRVLKATAGMHRWVWDLRYPSPPSLAADLPISAIFGDTPMAPQGPLALPGAYTAKLTVDGAVYSQPLTIKNDPRVDITPAQLAQQFALEMRISADMQQSFAALTAVRKLRQQIAEALPRAKSQAGHESLTALDEELAELAKPPANPFAPAGPPTFGVLNFEFSSLYAVVEGADAAPTAQADATFTELDHLLVGALDQWKQVQKKAAAALANR